MRTSGAVDVEVELQPQCSRTTKMQNTAINTKKPIRDTFLFAGCVTFFGVAGTEGTAGCPSFPMTVLPQCLHLIAAARMVSAQKGHGRVGCDCEMVDCGKEAGCSFRKTNFFLGGAGCGCGLGMRIRLLHEGQVISYPIMSEGASRDC